MSIWAGDEDPSRKILYLMKNREWDAARNLLLSNQHFDFTLTDKVYY